MSTLCGWASIGEDGARGNKSGDQRQRTSPDYAGEVKLGNWYDFGQREVLRWKDRAKAKKFASIIRAWCNNPHIGYDQTNRTTLGAWCKAHKWNYKVTANVETDCSRMVADAINCTMGREVIKIGETFYTGNLGARLKRTGLFTSSEAKKYTESGDYLMEGDIINNPASHVISALEDGSKVKKTEKKTKKKEEKKDPITEVAHEVIEGKWGNGSARILRLKNAGYNPTEVQEKVNAILGQGQVTKKAPKQIKSGKVIAKDGLNVRTRPSKVTGKIVRALPYGTRVACYQTLGRWWKIHPDKQEWVFGEYVK